MSSALDLISRNPFDPVRDDSIRAAARHGNVYFQENDDGGGLRFAVFTHNKSALKNRELIQVRCAGLTIDELFGTRKRAGELQKAAGSAIVLIGIEHLNCKIEHHLWWAFVKRTYCSGQGPERRRLDTRFYTTARVSLSQLINNNRHFRHLLECVSHTVIQVPAIANGPSDEIRLVVAEYLEAQESRVFNSEALNPIYRRSWAGPNQVSTFLHRLLSKHSGIVLTPELVEGELRDYGNAYGPIPLLSGAHPWSPNESNTSKMLAATGAMIQSTKTTPGQGRDLKKLAQEVLHFVQRIGWLPQKYLEAIFQCPKSSMSNIINKSQFRNAFAAAKARYCEKHGSQKGPRQWHPMDDDEATAPTMEPHTAGEMDEHRRRLEQLTPESLLEEAVRAISSLPGNNGRDLRQELETLWENIGADGIKSFLIRIYMDPPGSDA